MKDEGKKRTLTGGVSSSGGGKKQSDGAGEAVYAGQIEGKAQAGLAARAREKEEGLPL